MTKHAAVREGWCSSDCAQVPGFTHTVTDMYLEDVLRLIGYQDRLLGRAGGGGQHGQHASGQRPGAGQPRVASQAGQQAGAAAESVPQEQRAEIEGAIMDAFLHGGDEQFDRLLEVLLTRKRGKTSCCANSCGSCKLGGR